MELIDNQDIFYLPTLCSGSSFIYPTNTPQSNAYGTITINHNKGLKVEKIMLCAIIGNSRFPHMSDFFIDRAGGTSNVIYTYYYTIPTNTENQIQINCYNGYDGNTIEPYFLLEK
jgi:hypothetical protein